MCVYDNKKIKFKIKNQIFKPRLIAKLEKIKRLEYNYLKRPDFLFLRHPD
jgi:hypothetical protein